MRRTLLAFVFPFALVACGGASSDASEPGAPPTGDTATPPGGETPPHATCPSGYAFTTVAGKIVVKASLDGGPEQSWILDTGAPSSVIDPSVGKAYAGKDTKVKVGGVERTVTFDVAPAKLGIPGMWGILGQDVFGTVLTLDYPRQRFWIEDARNEDELLACTHVRGAPAIASAVWDNYLYVQGNVEGMQGWLLVDSGASYGVTRKGTFAALQQAHPRPALSGFYTPAAVGTFWADASTLGWLEVSGLRVEHVFTRTIDDDVLAPPVEVVKAKGDFLGCLPSGYLHHFMVTLDFAKQELRLDAKKDDDLREPTLFYVLGISLEQTTTTPVHVASVLPGSPAEADGIMAGDEIVAVEGAALASMDPSSWPFRLASQADGATIHVDVKHGDATTTHTLVTRDLLTSPAVP